MTAAETLWVTTGVETLKVQDWSAPSKSLKGLVEGIRGVMQGDGGV
jgi:hypothetical protein